jgi:hypothetical protein
MLPLPTLGVGLEVRPKKKELVWRLDILENIKYFGWFILLGSTYELVLLRS